jgi:hypothetical protein
MSRSVTAAMQAAAEARDQKPLLLIEALFDSGTLRLWSGLGDLAWNGEVWTGSGSLLRIEPGGETQVVAAPGANFVLSGIDSALVALALDEDYQGRPVTMWLGLFDAADAVIADPIPVFSGRLDVMEIDEGGETATIRVSAESRLADLERPPGGVWTDADQKSRYPTDRGLEFVAGLQDREVIWR